MEKVIFILLVIAIIIMIYLAIHFFKIDKDNKKTLNELVDEKVEDNKRIIELERRVKKLEKGSNYEERNSIRKDKPSNRTSK